jgi:hypothetical protein
MSFRNRITVVIELREAMGQGSGRLSAHLMRNVISLLVVLLFLVLVVSASAQDNSTKSPLCELQEEVAQGEHRTVRVEGVYLAGMEGQYLVVAGCSGRSTYVEFDLKSHRLWKRLVKISNRSNERKHVSGSGDPVLVVFEGEFYGPPVPDPRLPEAFRKIYHPPWDSQNASMTKLVVHAIDRAEPLPPDHPCAPPKSASTEWLCFQGSPAAQ